MGEKTPEQKKKPAKVESLIPSKPFEGDPATDEEALILPDDGSDSLLPEAEANKKMRPGQRGVRGGVKTRKRAAKPSVKKTIEETSIPSLESEVAEATPAQRDDRDSSEVSEETPASLDELQLQIKEDAAELATMYDEATAMAHESKLAATPHADAFLDFVDASHKKLLAVADSNDAAQIRSVLNDLAADAFRAKTLLHAFEHEMRASGVDTSSISGEVESDMAEIEEDPGEINVKDERKKITELVQGYGVRIQEVGMDLNDPAAVKFRELVNRARNSLYDIESFEHLGTHTDEKIYRAMVAQYDAITEELNEVCYALHEKIEALAVVQDSAPAVSEKDDALSSHSSVAEVDSNNQVLLDTKDIFRRLKAVQEQLHNEGKVLLGLKLLPEEIALNRKVDAYESFLTRYENAKSPEERKRLEAELSTRDEELARLIEAVHDAQEPLREAAKLVATDKEAALAGNANGGAAETASTSAPEAAEEVPESEPKPKKPRAARKKKEPDPVPPEPEVPPEPKKTKEQIAKEKEEALTAQYISELGEEKTILESPAAFRDLLTRSVLELGRIEGHVFTGFEEDKAKEPKKRGALNLNQYEEVIDPNYKVKGVNGPKLFEGKGLGAWNMKAGNSLNLENKGIGGEMTPTPGLLLDLIPPEDTTTARREAEAAGIGPERASMREAEELYLNAYRLNMKYSNPILRKLREKLNLPDKHDTSLTRLKRDRDAKRQVYHEALRKKTAERIVASTRGAKELRDEFIQERYQKLLEANQLPEDADHVPFGLEAFRVYEADRILEERMGAWVDSMLRYNHIIRPGLDRVREVRVSSLEGQGKGLFDKGVAWWNRRAGAKRTRTRFTP